MPRLLCPSCGKAIVDVIKTVKYGHWNLYECVCPDCDYEGAFGEEGKLPKVSRSAGDGEGAE